MGLFSRKKTTTVKAVAQRMLSDENFKYGTQQAVARWLWENSGISLDKTNLSEYLLEASKSGLPKRWDRLYTYAKKPNKYVFGLPTSHLSEYNPLDIKESLSDYLAREGVRESDIYSVWISDKDFYMSAWFILLNQYGYDSQTNELTSLSNQLGYPCYLVDGYLMVNANTFAEYESFDNKGLSFAWGEIPTSRVADTARLQTDFVQGTEDCFIVSYVGNGSTQTLKLELSFVNPVVSAGSLIPEEHRYIYSIYLKNGKYHFFEYIYGSGGIPELDNLVRVGQAFGDYYPKLYFRIDQKDVITGTDTTRKEHLKKALKYIDQDAKALTEQLQKGIGEHYGDVRGLYLFLGVRINEADQDSAIAEYCYRYFKRLYDLFGGNTVSQIIEDNVSKQDLYCSKMVWQRKAGKITEVGDYSLKTGIEPQTNDNKNIYIDNKDSYYHELIYQVNETEYESLKCYELFITIRMSGYSAVHTRAESDLIIPLDRALVKELSQKEKELLIHKSLHIQILLVKITKQKWYETSLFKIAVAIVGVVLSVVFAPAGTGFMAVLQQTAINALKAVAISYVINKALALAVKAGLIDLKTATVLSFVATIAVSAYQMNWDMSKILTAPNIMKVVNGAFDSYGKLMMIEIQDTQKKMAEHDLLIKDRQKQLAKAQKLLDTKVFDMDMELLKSNYTPSVNLFETVEMFYSRHHNFNVVELSHGLIHHFVEGSLRPNQLQPMQLQSVDEVMLSVSLV